MNGFRRSLAIMIGVNQYSDDIPPLRSAVNDATQLAEVLAKEHGYEVQLLTDQQVTLAALNRLLDETLPGQVGPDDRVLFYFAGHGIALDGDDGPAGYLAPQDARSSDRASFLAMRRLHQALIALTCRHLLLILDCCFAGAFRWSSTRGLFMPQGTLYQERYERFITDPAWEVITSAADDQQALDVLLQFGTRDDDGEHSPFARALLAALHGAADLASVSPDGPPIGDGVITAIELYSYLRDAVETSAIAQQRRQTPGLWTLSKHDKGEYIFLAPGRDVSLAPAPALSAENNPYRGLEPFEEQHKDLFFGRSKLIDVLQMIVAVQPLTVVLGASGTGKSSLVKAGLLPRLRSATDQHWQILGPLRPGSAPDRALASLTLAGADTAALTGKIAAWKTSHPDTKILLIVDQLEELITLCHDDRVRVQFLQALADALAAHADLLRVVLTIRSDFEPQFVDSALRALWRPGRFIVPPMTQDDLREAIRGPAAERVLYFEPDTLVDRIINEVVQMPGALPLLSFALSELYIKYLQRHADNRALPEADYDQLGGVGGALRNRASEEYQQLDSAAQSTMQRVMLRMVSLEGGELARRRVLQSELQYEDPAENQRVQDVIRRFSAARLLVEGKEPEGAPYVEPAHDELVRGWDRLWSWIRASQDTLLLQRRLTQAADDWAGAGRARGFLWDNDPRLTQLEHVRQSPINWLNQIETAFVKQSSAEKRTNRRRQIAAIATAMTFLIVLALVALQQRSVAVEQNNARATQVAIAGTAEANAEIARGRAEEQARLATSRQLAAQALTYLDNQIDLSLLLGMESYRIDPTLEARSSLLSGLEHNPRLTTFLHGHTATVSSLAFSRDGRTLVSGSQDDTIIFWDVAQQAASGEPIIAHSNGVHSVALSPDDRLLAAGGANHTIGLWDVATRQPLDLPLTGHTGAVYCVAFSPDGTLLASASEDHTIILWDVATRRPLGLPLTGHTGAVNSVAFSPNGKLLASASEDNTIILWDVASHTLLKGPLIERDFPISSVLFSPDGQTLASAGVDGRLTLWDVATGAARDRAEPNEGNTLLTLAFSPDGETLVIGTADNNIVLWGVTDHKLLGTPLLGHSGGVFALAFSPDSTLLASGGGDGEIILWDVTARQRLGTTLDGHSNRVLGVAYNPAGTLLASASVDNSIMLWDVTSDDPRGTRIVGHPGTYIGSVAFSPDGKLLASGHSDGSVFVWDVATRQPLGEPLLGHTGRVNGVIFSPDGTILASDGQDGTIILWDVATHQPLGEPLAGHTSQVFEVKFSPDGKLLASAGEDGLIIFWDVATRRQLGEPLIGTADQVNSIAFSPDGATLAASNSDGTVVFWDVATRQTKGAPLISRTDDINSIAFSPDGTILAAGTDKGNIVLWNVATRSWLGQPLQGFADSVDSVAFSPDGATVAAGTLDASVILWDIDIASWHERACEIANRNLTEAEWQQYIGATPYQETCP
jgi:WD40 repeat protein